MLLNGSPYCTPVLHSRPLTEKPTGSKIEKFRNFSVIAHLASVLGVECDGALGLVAGSLQSESHDEK